MVNLALLREKDFPGVKFAISSIYWKHYINPLLFWCLSTNFDDFPTPPQFEIRVAHRQASTITITNHYQTIQIDLLFQKLFHSFTKSQHHNTTTLNKKKNKNKNVHDHTK